MQLFKQQAQVVFRKNLKLHFSTKRFFINLLVPILCSILTLIFTDTDRLQISTTLSAIYLTLAINATLRQSINLLISERSTKQKEIQMINGLTTNGYYGGWLLSIWLLCFLTSLIYSVPQMIATIARDREINPFEILFSYSLYSIALPNATLFLSTAFEDPRKASEMLGLFNLFASFIVALIFIYPDSNPSIYGQLPLLFLPQSTIQLSWFSKNWLVAGQSKFTLNYWIYVMFLIIQIIGYLLMYLYFDQIIPRSYGSQKHPLFMLKWFKKQRVYMDDEQEDEESPADHLHSPILNIQSESIQQTQQSEEFILVENLSKKIDGIPVLNQLNLSVGQNEIYCLLGPNGAGKSTLMNILTGQIQKSKGKAKIYGCDIDDGHQYRQHIGICNQKDILYGELTVQDHLEYYGSLKILDSAIRQQQIISIINACGLQGECLRKANQLSGGNKRKLSFAISLLGNSPVLILDEPTSGMDPVSRQQLWGIIKQAAQNRAVIMTTHFLDEAEAIANRVAILYNGQIAINGSVDYIKLNFGVGYQLNIEFSSIEELQQKAPNIQKEISKLHSQLKIEQTNPQCLRVLLPFDKIGQYHGFLNYLEQVINCQYSLSMNTLEDSYLAIEERFFNVKPDKFTESPIFQQTPKPVFKEQLIQLFLRRFHFAISDIEQVLRFLCTWPLIWFAVYMGASFPFIFVYLYLGLKALTSTFTASLSLEERNLKIKEYMYASGVNIYAYWIGTLGFDLIPSFIEALFTSTLLAIYDVGFYKANFVAVLFMLTIMGLAFSCLANFFIQYFKNPTAIYVGMPLLFYFLFLNVCFVVIWFIIEVNVSASLTMDLGVLIIMLFNPFMSGLIGMSISPYALNYFIYSYPSCILWLLIGAAFYTFIGSQSDFKNFKKSQDQLIENGIQVEGVSKSFNGLPAIHNINLEVKKGEIFGLIGPSGAGKSTTFNVISKFERADQGNIKISNENTNVGLVPQFCPFYAHLNIEDHLRLYGKLKGQMNLEAIITQYLCAVGLDRFRKRQVKYLSGGERRKLQLGIALIGGSNILLMDEPTTGLDPRSKLVIQEILMQSTLQNNASVLLTTHSMTEAERICNKIGIMINGQLMIKGSIQELRQELGSFIRFSCQCNIGRKNAVHQLIMQNLSPHFPIQSIPDFRENYLSYQVPSDKVRISTLFYHLQIDLKEQKQLISDYRIYQTSLEQIFQFFSQLQMLAPQAQQQDLEPANPFDYLRILVGCCCCVFW